MQIYSAFELGECGDLQLNYYARTPKHRGPGKSTHSSSKSER